MITECTITCPHCGFAKEETMFVCGGESEYTCTRCAHILRPKEGECCVFCAYGNMICPPQQDKRNCCSG